MDNKKKKVVTGKVVSDKMDKSRVVAVSRKDKDSLYAKIIKKTTKYLVHDENNSAKTGDIVEIVYVKPLSNRKSWEILRIVEKASI